MKKLLLAILFFAALGAEAQTPISALPTYTADPTGGWVAVVVNGTTRKTDAKNLGNLDSLAVASGTTYDTLKVFKNGVQKYYKLIRAGGGFDTTAIYTAIGLRVPYTGANQNVDLGTYGVKADYFQFNTSSPTVTDTVGRMYWDSDLGTFIYRMNANVNGIVNQKEVVKVHNGTGSSIAAGKVVYISSSNGQLPTIVLANAKYDSTSFTTLGITNETIANGADGYVVYSGKLRTVNTSGLIEGREIYLDTIAGEFTQTAPTAPYRKVRLGEVVKANASGSLFLNIQSGTKIKELNDVVATSPTNGQVLAYQSSDATWRPANVQGALTLTTTGSSGAATLIGNTLNIPQYSGGGSGIDSARLADSIQAVRDDFANNEVSLSDVSNITWNYSLGNSAKVTLGGARALSISNIQPYSYGTLRVTQDANGGRLLNLPSGSRRPNGFALTSTANAIDLLAFYYDGTNYWWSISNNYETTSDSLITLDFPTQTGLTNPASEVWLGNNGFGGGYASYGLSDRFLPSSTNGYIRWEIDATDAYDAIVGFNTTNANQNYTNYEAGAYVSSGTIFRVDNGSVSSTGISLSVGDYLRIIRTGSSLKLQKSTGGVSWTDVYTYTFTSTAALYININPDKDKKIYYPKGVGVQ